MVKEEEIYNIMKKSSILTLTPIIYTVMYHYDDANSLKYIFERDPTKTIKTLPDV